MSEVFNAATNSNPEPEADPYFGEKWRAREDAVHRHIGVIVRNAAELEDTMTTLIAQVIDREDPGRVRPLVQGRRLSELIDTANLVLPDYPDKPGFIKALRAVNGHRDRLAHSTAGFDIIDFQNFDVHWIDRQGRATRTTHKLDVTAFPEVERDHTLVRNAAFGLFIGRVFPYRDKNGVEEKKESILAVIEVARRRASSHPWDDAAMARLSEVFAGDELALGLKTVDQKTL